jgi:rhodanese-related sulfurtransferase
MRGDGIVPQGDFVPNRTMFAPLKCEYKKCASTWCGQQCCYRDLRLNQENIGIYLQIKYLYNLNSNGLSTPAIAVLRSVKLRPSADTPLIIMNIDDILNTAHQRAQKMGLPYAGALTPKEALSVMQHHAKATLVDVRTRAEWDWVGRVPNAVEVEFMSYPGNVPNDAFVAELEQKVDKDALVLFLCRSGGRSHHAASYATEAGFAHSYNVLEGFEGDRDASGQRNKIGGWRAAGLPWVQG